MKIIAGMILGANTIRELDIRPETVELDEIKIFDQA